MNPMAAAWEMNGPIQATWGGVGIPGTMTKIVIAVTSVHSSMKRHFSQNSIPLPTANG
jgi:hypothetical protein